MERGIIQNYWKYKKADYIMLQASSSINFNERWQTLKKVAWSQDGLHHEFHVSCLTTHSLFGVKKEKMR